MNKDCQLSPSERVAVLAGEVEDLINGFRKRKDLRFIATIAHQALLFIQFELSDIYKEVSNG